MEELPLAETALAGLRVVDLSQGIAGPYCTSLLADSGAEVIKVEPPEGDYARRLGPFPDDDPHPDRGGLFVHLNGNKKSVTLDTVTPSGRAVLRRLLEEADVLVESDPPGRLASLGLGYDDLKAELPALVYCSVTPFGQTGPYAGFKGNSLACLALSGLMYVTGDPDREPLATGGEAAEYFAGVNGWVAVLAALEHRAGTGAGQHVDVSMLESLGSADEYNTAMYAACGAIRKRYYSHHHIPAYPAEIYACKDGHIVVVSGVGGFPLGMALLLEQPELQSNPLFINFWMRMLQWRQFEEILRPYLLEHDWRDLLTRAQELRMPFGPVMSPQLLLEDEHLRQRGFFEEVGQPGMGELRLAGAPFRMGETPLRRGPAPALGQHTHETLSDAGYDDEDARVLRERGVT
jgi:crotonobetainyl-CoA:carnitine CoA-transferase CaiB-like acyl-CoA transferase